MSTRIIGFFLVMVVMIGLMGCAPKSFVRTMEPTWASVEVKNDIPYEKAWACVVDLLAKRFDLVVISKEAGYVRTAWLYTWTGTLRENYRVRVIAKFSPDKKKVEVKSEAQYSGPSGWIMGSDTRLLSTLKTDIMGSVGRTTR